LVIVAVCLGSACQIFWNRFPKPAERSPVVAQNQLPSATPNNPPDATEKPEPKPSPKPRSSKNPVPASPVLPPPPVTQTCTGSNCIGVNNGSATQSIIVDTPPLKLAWSVVADQPTGGFPYRQTVTVKTNVDFHPVSLVVMCSEEIKNIQAYGVFNSPRFGITKDSKKVGYIYYENPPLAPGVPLVISVDSASPFSVVDVQAAILN
jgi:hypothetical protein